MNFLKLFVVVSLLVSLLGVSFVNSKPSSFERIKSRAKNQTVYFNAWGGSKEINDYLAWTTREVRKRFNFKVVHVKINDTAVAVNRVLAEKQANKNTEGSVGLIWINGENFKTMKDNDLLFGPFSDMIPNVSLIDFSNKEFTLVDFSVPTDGLEVPWGMAKLVFFYDSKKVKRPSKSMQDLLILAKNYPGRLTYPKPPSFHGTTFIKQILLEKVKNHAVLQKPVASKRQFDEITKPLWKFLDDLHPHVWRNGKSFPKSLNTMHQMLNDGELFFAFSFNPNKALNLIEKGEIPSTVKVYTHEQGTIANAHFLAIPYNSPAKEAAMVYINFLLSPEAQGRKANYKVWGDPTILSISKLPPEDKKYFDNLSKSSVTLSEEKLGKNYLEPHASWVKELEREWLARYGS